MTAALFLLICGLDTSLVRRLTPATTPKRRIPAILSAIALSVSLGVLAVLGLGTTPVGTTIVAACALIWCCVPGRPTASAAILIALTTLFLLVDIAAASPQAPLVRWYATTHSPLTDSSSVSALIAGLGLLPLIGPASNDVVTDALMWAGRRPHRPGGLRGGRVIGPLERLLIIALCLTGAYGALAALVAAKGVVRFPEISRDHEGVKAEEFLIGSLASWSLAGAAALAVTLCR